ncbi:unnamed protein product [Prorocentrum cordatum]|uniref:Macro domain-containing protein n=1 Tax=Prorocentrum cordatum TaxID=2364126 RepID=A0ABN9TV30_9DINO|nr:unnamed protein product [Polarella glacialis]
MAMEQGPEDGIVVVFLDTSRARPHVDVTRELCNDIPAEHPEHEYITHARSRDWLGTCTSCLRHGSDFILKRPKRDCRWMKVHVGPAFVGKGCGLMGPRRCDQNSIAILAHAMRLAPAVVTFAEKIPFNPETEKAPRDSEAGIFKGAVMRRSTSGAVVSVAGPPWRGNSITEASVRLSSGKAEARGVAPAYIRAPWAKFLAIDLGFATRGALWLKKEGRLWTPSAIARGGVDEPKKVPGKLAPLDALTKANDWTTLERQMNAVSLQALAARASEIQSAFAVERLRYCVRCALQAASSQGLESIALPSLGGGVFGYEPRQCSSIFLDEAVESLLQIEASDPSYTLKRITFVDSHPETAEAFGAALTDAAYRWLPERRLTTAPQFWGQATRRLLVLPDAPNFFLKRWRIKFKQRHGVKRRVRKHYLSNWIPWLWRAQKVAQPPPLLVHARSGDVAAQDRQLPARPYFFRGVSHWLFPSRRSGFNLLRRTSSGHWKGVLRQFRLVDAVRPRA